jgi:probable F420-dependent oxidoreductase
VSKPRLALSFTSATFEPADLPALLTLARVADENGVDAIRVPEHVALGSDTSSYAWGKFGYPLDAPWLEPLTFIAAMAAVTKRVKFFTGVLIAPLRPAVILAKQAAAVDVLSGSRLVLGVGAGWQPEELAAGGVPFSERGARMTEVIAACRVLWTQSPATFHGRWTHFNEVWSEPKPSRRSGVPVWFGGSLSSRMLRRLVELGDGWMPIMGSTPAQISADRRRVEEAMQRAGRTMAGFDISTLVAPVRDNSGKASLERTLESARQLSESGVTVVSLYWPRFDSAERDGSAWIERVASVWSAL